MTIEEKRQKIDKFCHSSSDCARCPQCGNEFCDNHNHYGAPDNIIEKWYELFFGVDEPTPVIKDSGERRQFDTGAVRDIQEGKGRCDLMPLDVVAEHYHRAFGDDDSTWKTLQPIALFKETGDPNWLELALIAFVEESDFTSHSDMFLETSKHFEEGAKKYQPDNWKKGIPLSCYLDSTVRHYLKWLRGDKDEPHDRAFCWNILCAIWTCKHKPELNDYAPKRNENTCVCCGASIPEGWQYCQTCWENVNAGG